MSRVMNEKLFRKIVSGAIKSTITAHPDWVASKVAGDSLRISALKRAVGQFKVFAEQSAGSPLTSPVGDVKAEEVE